MGSRRSMLVKPVMYSPVARPSSSRAAPAKKRKQSTIGGISSDLVGASGLPTFSDSIRASSSPSASMAWASLSNRSPRSRGVVSDQPSSKALRAAATARLTSSSVPFGTCAMTLPVAGFTISCTASPAPGVHSPPMNISCLRSVVLIRPPSGAKRGAEYVQPLLQLIVGDRQRHERAHDVVVHATAQDDQPLLTRGAEDLRRLLVRRLLLLPVAHQLETRHRSDSPDVAYHLVLFRPALHPLFNDRADAGGSLGQLLIAHDVHDGHARRTRHRIAAVGAAQTTRVRRVHDLRPADHRGQRETRGQALGDCDEVRLHA